MSDILGRLRVQARSGLMFLPHDFKVVSYGEAADEIARLRTAISEAEQRARRKALEEAAQIVIRNAPATQDFAGAPLQDHAARAAKAIRAIIPSEPPSMEGRNATS